MWWPGGMRMSVSTASGASVAAASSSSTAVLTVAMTCTSPEASSGRRTRSPPAGRTESTRFVFRDGLIRVQGVRYTLTHKS
jgi:hypothetical protein